LLQSQSSKSNTTFYHYPIRRRTNWQNIREWKYLYTTWNWPKRRRRRKSNPRIQVFVSIDIKNHPLTRKQATA